MKELLTFHWSSYRGPASDLGGRAGAYCIMACASKKRFFELTGMTRADLPYIGTGNPSAQARARAEPEVVFMKKGSTWGDDNWVRYDGEPRLVSR